MTRRQRTAFLVGFLLLGTGITTALVLRAFSENLLYFVSPSEVVAGKAPQGTFRVGGMVKAGSVRREPGSLTVEFDVTDFAHDVTVEYRGVLPDLFREGQGVIARGRLGPGGRFLAEEVLAKHDEKYMPPEVAESLKTAEAGGQPR